MEKRYRKLRSAVVLIFMIAACTVSFFRISFVSKYFLWLILGESAFLIEQLTEHGIESSVKKAFSTGKRKILFSLYIISGLALMVMCLITDGGYPLFRNVIILSVLTALAGGLIAFLQYFSWEKSIARITGLLVSVSGLIFMMIIPFGVVPDEAMHLYTAYHVSDQILHTVSDDPQRTMMRVEDTEYKLTGTEYDDETMEAFFTRFDKQNNGLALSEQDVPLVKGYDYLYVIPAMGISLGRICHLNTFQTFLLGRLFNLILSVICISMAISLMPFGKMILMIMSLMPMTLQQAMSYSYDAPINAMFFLFIALVMQSFYGKKKETKIRLISMIILAVLIAMVKSHAYVMLSVLPLFMWSRTKMKSLTKKRKTVIRLSIVIVLFLICAGVFLAAEKMPAVQLKPKDSYSILFLLQNPGEIINIIYRTFTENSAWYLDTMVGMYLGYLNLKISPLIIYMIYLLLLISTVKERDEEQFISWGDRFVFLLCAFFITVFTFGGMLLANSEYKDHIIRGMQGRYLLPAVMLMVFCFRNTHIQKDHAMDHFVFGGELIVLLVVMCNLIAII